MMELQSPPLSFRAPYPHQPVIIPARTYYRVSSVNDEDGVPVRFECVSLDFSSESKQKHSGPVNEEKIENVETVEERNKSCKTNSAADAIREIVRSGSRVANGLSNKIPQSILNRLNVHELSSILQGSKNLREGIPDEVELRRKEEKISRWLPTNAYFRRFSDEGTPTRHDEDSEAEISQIYRRRISNDLDKRQIRLNWRLSSESERSWNKSSRPMKDMILNYERPSRSRERESKVPKQPRLSSSSRLPVSEMSRQYMRSSSVGY